MEEDYYDDEEEEVPDIIESDYGFEPSESEYAEEGGGIAAPSRSSGGEEEFTASYGGSEPQEQQAAAPRQAMRYPTYRDLGPNAGAYYTKLEQDRRAGNISQGEYDSRIQHYNYDDRPRQQPTPEQWLRYRADQGDRQAGAALTNLMLSKAKYSQADELRLQRMNRGVAFIKEGLLAGTIEYNEETYRTLQGLITPIGVLEAQKKATEMSALREREGLLIEQRIKAKRMNNADERLDAQTSPDRTVVFTNPFTGEKGLYYNQGPGKPLQRLFTEGKEADPNQLYESIRKRLKEDSPGGLTEPSTDDVIKEMHKQQQAISQFKGERRQGQQPSPPGPNVTGRGQFLAGREQGGQQQAEPQRGAAPELDRVLPDPKAYRETLTKEVKRMGVKNIAEIKDSADRERIMRMYQYLRQLEGRQ